MSRKSGRGMTLTEILVALTIVAVLLSIALPAYHRYLQRGHRADAVRALLGAAACQERVRAGGGLYDTSQCRAARTGYYRFRYDPPARPGVLQFTVFAEPLGSDDDDCGTLWLDQAGNRGTSAGVGKAAPCWGGR